MIYITDTLRISKVDENCLQLEAYQLVTSKKTGTSTPQWKWCGYYGNLKEALRGALKKQLFNTADEDLHLSELISRIETAEENVLKAIKTAIEGK